VPIVHALSEFRAKVIAEAIDLKRFELGDAIGRRLIRSFGTATAVKRSPALSSESHEPGNDCNAQFQTGAPSCLPTGTS
jgi:hypothetical protein